MRESTAQPLGIPLRPNRLHGVKGLQDFLRTLFLPFCIQHSYQRLRARLHLLACVDRDISKQNKQTIFNVRVQDLNRVQDLKSKRLVRLERLSAYLDAIFLT
jgi:hypothetical protein